MSERREPPADRTIDQSWGASRSDVAGRVRLSLDSTRPQTARARAQMAIVEGVR